MNYDTFSAGVEPGGLHTRNEIKLLICYMLGNAGGPISRNDVLDIVCADGMANFFDTSAAIDELIELHNLCEQEDGTLTVTAEGAHATNVLVDHIPYTLRERSVKAALRLLSRRRNEQENHVDIQKTENGYTVTCTVGGGETPLLTFTLLVADDRQAEQVQEQFLQDPLLLYQSLIAVLTGGASFETADRITIDLK
ncbi:MAG: DUF4364 family protein [Clostridia bacterium]|nr:DUF4364 family protein [Clostridia bacterium]